MGNGSTTLPGFIFQSGSQMDLNSRKASTSSCPNILGSISALLWPSPCSPESEPPSDTQRSAASSRKDAPPLDARPPCRGRSDPSVEAALPEVAVERAVVPVPVEGLPELPEVLAHPLRAGPPSPPSRARCPARSGGNAVAPRPASRTFQMRLALPASLSSKNFMPARWRFCFSASISRCAWARRPRCSVGAELDQKPAVAIRAAAWRCRDAGARTASGSPAGGPAPRARWARTGRCPAT